MEWLPPLGRHDHHVTDITMHMCVDMPVLELILLPVLSPASAICNVLGLKLFQHSIGTCSNEVVFVYERCLNDPDGQNP